MVFRFASPFYFVLLAVIPLAIYFRRKRRVHPVIRLPGIPFVKDMKPSAVLRVGWIPDALKYLAFFLMVVGLARPQWGTEKINVTTEGINIILALDLSGSMAALDFKKNGKIVNRLEAVKGVVKDFISKRDGDRIGLVVFGSEAYTQAPLTRDYNTIVSILDRLEIGAAGPNTAVGDAIGISLKRISDIESKSNVIILLTDGASNSGELDPKTAAEIAAEKKVKIYTIGVGTKGKPVLIRDPQTGRYVYSREIYIDEDTLRMVAEKAGGLYFRAQETGALEKIYDKIDKLEKTRVEVKTYADYREYYPYVVIPAFFLVCAWLVLVNTRFLRVP